MATTTATTLALGSALGLIFFSIALLGILLLSLYILWPLDKQSDLYKL